ncbi:MAG: ribulose-phosphate 3-epimerase [Parcubacteria group bacterium Gr01-1014_49]|nr:MAG: ribulose-phosphate 3-epimerase [Parcubacteria group bacterium Gr01-1014_49]
MGLIVPAVLPSSRIDLEEKLALFARIPLVSRVQIDVVDGHFASPASWPYSAPGELQSRAKQSIMLPDLDRITYEIDLMCHDAERAAGSWLTLGAARLTFHAESTTDLPRLLASARVRYGDFVAFGLAINIGSELRIIEPLLENIEYVQFMGIARIGRQGQSFDRRVLEKIRVFRNHHPDIPVQVDGGVTLESAKKLLALGVSNLVVGSSILKAKDPATAFAQFEALESPFGV